MEKIMKNERESGHVSLPGNTPWNRSSALSPEALGVINTETEKAVRGAIQMFETALADANITLTYKQKVKAHSVLVNRITKAIAKMVEAWKSDLQIA
jgi:enamine deaminase RidA (YjgF/YER057c/UK114 family)